MPLQPGTFTAVLRVSDSNGQSDTDWVSLTVSASTNAQLSALGLSGGMALDPAFKPETENYTASVPFETSQIGVGAMTLHPAASVKVGLEHVGVGDTVRTGLKVGDNLIELTVLSQSGVQKQYRVTVYRRKNTDAKLSGLEVVTGTLQPGFHPETSEYRVTVGNGIMLVSLRAQAHDSAGATLRMATEGSSDTVELQSGVLSGPQGLDVGARALQVWVTAQDGTTRRLYRVSVTRQASPTATLSSLLPSAGTLRPDFTALTAEYFDTVGYAQDKMSLRGVSASDNALQYQGGRLVASGVEGPVVSFRLATPPCRCW